MRSRSTMAGASSPLAWFQRRDLGRHLGASRKSRFAGILHVQSTAQECFHDVCDQVCCLSCRCVDRTELDLSHPSATDHHVILCHQHGQGQRRRPWRPHRRRCALSEALAKAAGRPNELACLSSTTEPGGVAGVNARDRIGKGPRQNPPRASSWRRPWRISTRIPNNINKQTALTSRARSSAAAATRVNMMHTQPGRTRKGSIYGRWRHHLRELDEKQRRIGHCGPP